MTVGKGVGSFWGGSSLDTTSGQTTEVDGDYVVFDFSDESNGALPGSWEFSEVVRNVSTGAFTIGTQSSPSSWFLVQSGVGKWNYTEEIAGSIRTYRGVMASPAGIMVTGNGTSDAVLVSPGVARAEASDSFTYEVTLATRSSSTAYNFVGGRVRAAWASGSWTVPAALEIVASNGTAMTVLASAVVPTFPDFDVFWKSMTSVELSITTRGATIEASLNGGLMKASASIPSYVAESPGNVVVLSEVYNTTGATSTAAPSVRAVRYKSLRDSTLTVPGIPVPGDIDLEAHPWPVGKLDVGSLLESKALKRKGSRQFVFMTATTQNKMSFGVGDVIRALEPWVGQASVPVVIDINAARGGP